MDEASPRPSPRDARRDLLTLPANAVAHVFGFLPSLCRLRCREVSTGWKAFLDHHSLWRCVDLAADLLDVGPAQLPPERTLHLFLALAERCRGGLRSLSLSGVRGLPFDAVRGCVAANAATLTELRLARMMDFHTPQRLADVLALAPRLTRLEADARMPPAEALRLLAPPGAEGGRGAFAPLALHELWVEQPVQSRDSEVDMTALSAALRGHAPLCCLMLQWVPLRRPGELSGLLAAVEALPNLRFLYLVGCGLSPHHLPVLTQLLDGSCRTRLEQLWLSNSHQPLLTGPGVVDFAEALTRSSLQRLTLACMRLWESWADAREVLTALRRCGQLRELDVSCNEARGGDTQAAVGALLGQLVAGEAAAGGCAGLESLNVDYNSLTLTGCLPLFQALPVAQRLLKLVVAHNQLGACSPAQPSGNALARCLRLPDGPKRARRRLLALVRENGTLRSLKFGREECDKMAELAEAEALVKARGGREARE